jgi:hypothetical protein
MATSKRESGLISWEFPGAGNGDRTRDPKLGKLVLCRLSYARSSHAHEPLAEHLQPEHKPSVVPQLRLTKITISTSHVKQYFSPRCQDGPCGSKGSFPLPFGVP